MQENDFHWAEIISEFTGTAMMIFIGLSAVAINFGVGSPMSQFIPDAKIRLLLTAVLFAGGGTAIVYSPLGRRSGGHLNPAVTLLFWLMKKIKTHDAITYMLAQLAGAILGSFLVYKFWGSLAVSTHLGVTTPGDGTSALTAFSVEVIMTFLLCFLILWMLSAAGWAPYTGLTVGVLVVGLVYFGAGVSGTSINPARSLGPAIVIKFFKSIGIYLTAPFLGSILAATIFNISKKQPYMLCAKIYHSMKYRCIFCKYDPTAM